METSTWSDDLSKSSLRTSLQSEQSQRPGRSKDIYEASNRHPETGHPLQKKTGAVQKIFESAAFKKLDEHVPVIRKALRRVNVTLPSSDQQAEASFLDHTLFSEHPISSGPQGKHINLPKFTPPSGPIPNSKLLSPRPSNFTTRTRPIDLYFLTTLESEVHNILHRTGRVAIYKGLLTKPTTTTLLAHPTDIPPLQRIRSLTQKMEPEDRHKLATTLETLIDQKMRYVLNILLWEDNLRVTDKSVGTGVESPEYVKSSVKKEWRRPTSFEMIRAGVTGVRESWIQNFKGKKQEAEDAQKKPFTIFEERDEEVSEAPRLKGLRGGGAEDDFQIPGSRSAKAYARLALGSTSGQEKLGDEERVPRIMWWLAGGSGVLGTVFGVRERRRKDDGDEDEGGQAEEVKSGEAQAKDDAIDEPAGQAEGVVSEESQAEGTDGAPAEEIAEAVESAAKA